MPSQISAWNNTGFAFYLIQDGDDALFTEEKTRALVKKLHELQPIIGTWAKETANIDPPTDLSSLQNYYRYSLNQVIWRRLPILLKELNLSPSTLELNKLVASFAPTIIREHLGEYLKLAVSNFLSAFNQLRKKPARAWWISNHYRFTILVILMALLLGVQQLRAPITLFAATHILHMLFCSIGSCIEQRYISTTEFCMLLAFSLALYSLGLRFLAVVATRLPDIFLKRHPDKRRILPRLSGKSTVDREGERS